MLYTSERNVIVKAWTAMNIIFKKSNIKIKKLYFNFIIRIKIIIFN